MRYPTVIEAGTNNTAFGAVVPDLPGCFSAGDTLNEALSTIEEAAQLWVETALDAGEEVPAPSTLAAHQKAYLGWLVGFVTLDPALLDNCIERVNISLPRRVLGRLDALALQADAGTVGKV
ncbi:hypothetical protein E3E12_08520 [Formicincola oecophyllae]|uniref:HicB-like antitoxin of toxin-antitoxin system domain-containing protein n=1 Tax=Formicincola oecophyllae TaxID=2558361 RepID=A0A4Y6UAQ4_9PROT|nr:type II toxin-antitoxin system HicB family antitoxin [Formicincola oecophyllae]QDH14224.1 hypothetical protein E3E12_08520 [Formicincola oecophyllae]